jgi:peptidoglycan/LPS O-acetylase OafA/YrhL
VWVILHHLTGAGMMLDAEARRLPAFASALIYPLVRGGYLAVTTFFALSGFVLARCYGSTEWNRGNLLRYGVGRLARIYPVYALSLLLVAPFIAEDRSGAKARLLAVHGFLLQGWTGHLPVSWNTPAWSLSCEIFFYLAFQLSAVLIQRANWFNTLAVAAFACCLTRLMWRLGVADDIKPLVHLSDFLMGVAAACVYGLLARDGLLKGAGWWFYLPGLTLAAALIVYPRVLPAGVDLNTAMRPLNGALLIGFAIGSGAVASALSTRIAVCLGKASYAIYILHVPILWWYLRCSRGFSAIAYFALVIGSAVVVYRAIEEPANRGLRARIHRTLEA